MTWWEAVEESQSLVALYAVPPPLQKVRILEIMIRPDEDQLVLRLNLPTFADFPLDSWVRQGFNTVQVILQYEEVSELSLERWSVNNVVDITYSDKGPEGGEWSMSSSQFSMYLCSKQCRLVSVREYRQEMQGENEE